MSKIEGFSRRGILAAGLLTFMATALGHIIVLVVRDESLGFGLIQETALGGSGLAQNIFVPKTSKKNEDNGFSSNQIERLRVHRRLGPNRKAYAVIRWNDVLELGWWYGCEKINRCLKAGIVVWNGAKDEILLNNDAGGRPSVFDLNSTVHSCADRQFTDYRTSDAQPCPLLQSHMLDGLLRNVGALLGGFGGYLRLPEAPVHVPSLRAVDKKLKDGGERQYRVEQRDVLVPPIARRFFIALAALILMLPVVRLGFYFLDRGRRWIGLIVCGCGLGIAEGSIVLLWLSQFRWSWGWWW